jgi:hypothetical protein
VPAPLSLQWPLQFAAEVRAEELRYERELAAWQARRCLPCWSDSLSSLHRPAAGSQRCLDLFMLVDTPLLHALLSFLDDFSLFFRFPALSHSHARAFTEPSLHRLYGQQRSA